MSESDGATSLHRPWFARVLAWSSAVEARKGGTEHRRRLLAGMSGRVIEIGAGTGNNFAHYPPAVTEVVAIEPEANLRAMAVKAAANAPVPVRVVDATADQLPVDDASMDAGVVAGVLCSVPDPSRALQELARAIRPGGELRFYEHVIAQNPIPALAQRALRATIWPRLFGGCHPDRSTDATIQDAGFTIEACERFTFWGTVLSIPVSSRILGRAVRPTS